MAVVQHNTAPPAMTLTEWVVALRRRSGMMAILFVSILAVMTLLAFLWPATYQSAGTILIEQQELPTDLVRSTISSYADQRIQVISQRVMTTENLFKIIQKYDLYARERKTKAREKVLEKMKEDIGFKMISADVIDPRSGNPTKATIAFTVSYKHRSAELAAKVANELVSLYLQQNIDSRKQRTADATSFLTDEAGRLDKDISEQQAAIATFKEKHANELPELAQTNLQMLTRIEDERRETDTRIRSLDQQIVYLDAQLAQINPTEQMYASTGERVMAPKDRLKYARSELARVSSLYSSGHPDVVRLKREVAGLEKSLGAGTDVNDLRRQLESAKTELASAQQRYSADHPDVSKWQRSVDALQQQIATAQSDNEIPVSRDQDADNPAYIQIRAQREASVNERRSLEQKRSQLDRQLKEYETRLTTAPSVEREYSGMLRDLDNNQIKYREVRQKQMEATVAQNMEDERKGERFTLIEPPLTPEQPDSPNRILLLVLGVLLALASAIGIPALLEMTDTRVRNRRDLEHLLQVAPLAVVPWIETISDKQVQRRRFQYFAAGSLGSVVVMLGVLHLFYRPLDVLWQVLLRRLTS